MIDRLDRFKKDIGRLGGRIRSEDLRSDGKTCLVIVEKTGPTARVVIPQHGLEASIDLGYWRSDDNWHSVRRQTLHWLEMSH